MSQWDKLIKRILSLSNDLRFDELRRVLESLGYTMSAPRSGNIGYKMNAPKGGSSHYTFRKNGSAPITIPKHEPIKKVYVLMVKEVIESEEKNDEDS